ncbi:MAG: zinc-dependent alcohol dehydrogenase family protein [Kiloniellales bacterium]
MKAVELTRFGIPHEVCRCVDAADVGAPGDDEVVIEVEACPINPADLLIIEGRYPGPSELPARLGIEGVGRVVAVGEGVGALKAGDRAISLARTNWAQRIKLKAAHAIKVPGDADVLQLAMVKVNPPTAMVMLRDYVDLEPGDWVIQNAANSAVGGHVIRLAKARGLRTVNLVRRQALVDGLTRIGADVVLVDGDDLAARVKAATGGADIRLALDAICGQATLHLADCLAPGGIVVNYGYLSGEPCMIKPDHTIVGGITLTGFWLVKVLRTMSPAAVQQMYDELSRHIVDGTLQTPVEATYRIEDIEPALAHAGRQARDGKILLTPNGPVT